MKLRPLRPQDVERLHALETAANVFPWSRAQFTDSFRDGHFGWAVEEAGQLQGFALFARVLDEATLLNVIVDPALRRRGIGRQLLLDALRELARNEVRRCLLEVRVGNAAAIALYRALGFVADGTRRDYYPAAGGRENALLMSRDLPEQNLEII